MPNLNPEEAVRAAEEAKAAGRAFAGRLEYPDGTKCWAIYQGGEWVEFSRDPGFGWVDIFGDLGEGLILEFGVQKGGTITEIAGLTDRTVYGFDWWRGLPQAWSNGERGFLSCDKPEVPNNVELIEGLFSDSLEGFLELHPGPVAFVNVDCDLYTSSLYVLNSLKRRFIPGSYVALSGITLHLECNQQRQAWDKYLKDSKQKWEFKGKQHAWGEVYKCLET